MKKTININLSGYPFIIDEDAYNLLKDYLDTIKYAFETGDDTGELAADIESRIAELFMKGEDGKVRIVSISDVSQVIDRIGKPSQFIEVEETVKSESSHPDNRTEGPKSEDVEKEETIFTEEKTSEKVSEDTSASTPPPYEPPRYSGNPLFRKKLFRNPQNAMLGGVCSGLAAYFGIDVTVVRIIAVLLFLFSASTIAIIYVVMWIVVPEARTPLQRMQMFGEDPTMENIGRTVTGNYGNNYNNGFFRNPENTGFLSTAFSIFVKCLIIIGLLVALPLFVAFGLGLIGCIIAVFVIAVGIVGGGMFDTSLEGLMVLFILLAIIGGIITLGIPLWLLIRKLWKKNDPGVSDVTRRSLLIVWLIGIALVSVFSVQAVRKGRQLEKYNHDSWHENSNTVQVVEVVNDENTLPSDSLTVVNEQAVEVVEESKDKKVEMIEANEGEKVDLVEANDRNKDSSQ